jgi:diguanylate cyclase (GGDEF)-like protein
MFRYPPEVHHSKRIYLQSVNPPKQADSQRKTIGVLIKQLHHRYQSMICPGILDGAKSRGYNICIFVGKSVNSPSVIENHENVIYSLADRQNIDGLIIVTGAIGNYLNADELKDFCYQYSHIPTVNIAVPVEGIPTVWVDNKKGMNDMVSHFIRDHGYTRIAFIRGPSNNIEAEQRYNVFQEVLNQYNIPLISELVYEGDFILHSGIDGVKTILDERGQRFDAILAANDEMLVGVFRELSRRGIKVPGDVAIGGFDNIEEARIISPQFTTVAQPLYMQGNKAIEMLADLIKGKRVPELFEYPTHFIVRQSCGCNPESFFDLKNRGIPVYEDGKESHPISPDIRDSVFNTLIADIELQTDTTKTYLDQNKLIQCILDAFLDDIDGSSNESKTVRYISETVREFRDDIDSQEFMKTLLMKIFSLTKPVYGKSNRLVEKANRINYISQCILMDSLSHNYQNSVRKLRDYNWSMLNVTKTLSTVFNLDELRSIILELLPTLDVTFCFIALYENDGSDKIPTPGSRVFLYYQNDGKKYDCLDNMVFETKRLLPDDILIGTREFSLVVFPLLTGGEQFGFIIFEYSQQSDPLMGEVLQGHISAAIKSATLLEKVIKQKEKETELSKSLSKANMQLKELDSLKNDFIANITHDLRSPLTSIYNISDIALKYSNTNFNPKIKPFKVIYESAVKLKKSIDRLLDIAKMDAKGLRLNVCKVNPVLFLERIVNFYQSSVSGSCIMIILKVNVGKIDDFYTDGEKLEAVMDNIISNAIKFVDSDNGIITIELTEKQNLLRICVSDNGIGIQKDILENVFDRFFQANDKTRGTRKGTGIGLAFSRQLIGYMHGRIWAESEGLNTGSRFYVELKRGLNVFSAAELEHADQMIVYDSDEREIIKNEIRDVLEKKELLVQFDGLKNDETDYMNSRILVVDDDKIVQDILRQYLQNQGYHNFIFASDGKQGLDAVYEYSPDIIISDFDMPNIRGDEFHDTLLNNPQYRHIPVIFLSAISDNQVIIGRKKKGACAYLCKPIDEKDLLITIEQQLIRHYEYKKILRLATIDELTGLNNRRTIIQSLYQELSVRKYRDLSVMFIDVDSFKQCNDSFGHQNGDRILSAIGKMILSIIRDYDIAGRYGGDEFLIILPDANIQQGRVVAEALAAKVRNSTMTIAGEKLEITLSIGISSLIDYGDYISRKINIHNIADIYNIGNPEKEDWDKISECKNKIADIMIEMADEALYKAKTSMCHKCGKNMLEIQSSENPICTECGSTDIEIGRNRVMTYDEK